MRLHTRQVIIGILVVLALVTPLPLGSVARADDLSTGPTIIEYDSSRLIVQLKPDAEMTEFAAASSFVGAEILDALSPIRTQIMEVPSGQLQDAYEQLKANPHVAEVYYDTVIHPAYVPNDPYFNNGSQWGPQKIGATAAWDVTQGSAVIIAIVDSGVDPNHPDLYDRLIPGYNIYDSNTDTSDVCGHGTHLAGIAAATSDNAEGIAGIAPQAKIMPVKVLSDNCAGSYSRLISGIAYAADHGADVIVISSGATVYNPGLHAAVTYARDRGTIVVAAAGNYNSSTPFYPAAHPEAIAVAGSDQDDNRYSVSNYGDYIDIAAPAPGIYSTYISNGQSTYAYMGGTSMAAPHVGGVVALLAAIAPDAGVETLEQYLTSSAADLGDAGWDMYFGHGRVNAQAALGAALADAATPELPTPTPTPVPPTPTPTPTEIPPTPTPVPPTPTPTPTEIPPTPTPVPPTPTPTPTEIPPTPTPEPPTPMPTPETQTIHVDNASLRYVKRWFDWQVTATILIANSAGEPVKDSTVSFSWGGAYSGTASCITADDGRCSVTSRRVRYSRGQLTLSIDHVAHASLAYDPAANKTPNPLTGIAPQRTELDAAPTAIVDGNSVHLHWVIHGATPVQNVVLYRSYGNDPERAQRLTNNVTAAQTEATSEFEYTDPLVTPDGLYTYWLVTVEDGQETDLIDALEVTIGSQGEFEEALYLPMLSR